MGLIDEIPVARTALADARRGEAGQIAAGLDSTRVVGVLGEAEVGKTDTVGQALAMAGPTVIRLDLDAAASDGHIGFLLAKEIAKATVPPSDFSLLSGGVLLPRSAEKARAELAGLLGVEGLEEALRPWPSGHFSSAHAMQIIESVASRKPIVLWIDHPETPSLTPRHPVDVDRLLWGVREVVQRQQSLRVVVSSRAAFSRQLLGPKAAFHQQGSWISLDNPLAGAWRSVAERLEIPVGLADEIFAQVDGHPATMLHAFLLIVSSPSLPHSYALLQELAARDDGLSARAIQHARTLHRLGAQVMTQVAYGEPPYGIAERGASSPQEIRKVLERLRLAGLLKRKDGWGIVNPLVAIRLRGSVRVLLPPLSPGP
jgi:hypothetical protein